MNSIIRTIARLKASFTIIRSNKVLLWYPVLSILLTLGLFAAGGIGIVEVMQMPEGRTRDILLAVVTVATFLIINLIGIFSSGALFSAATSALEGEKVSFTRSFTKVWKNRRALSLWWLFSSAAFFLLLLIQIGLDKLLSVLGKGSDHIISAIIGNVLSIGWAFATYFAVPVLMTHPDTPIPTLKRSAALFKKSWGEKVTGDASLFLLGFVIVALIGLVVMGINFVIFTVNPDVNSLVFPIVYGVLAGPLLAAMVILFPTASAIFTASLYRYAETGDYVGPFTPEMIQGAFPKKKGFLR